MCNTCKKKCDAYRKNDFEKLEKVDLKIFSPHSDENCSICFSSKKSSKTSSSFWKMLEQNLKDINIFKMVNLNIPDKIYYRPYYSDDGCVYNSITLHVHSNFQWSMSVFGNNICADVAPLNNLPRTIDEKNCADFCLMIDSLNICSGNKDFSDVIEKRVKFKEPFESITGGRAARVFKR